MAREPIEDPDAELAPAFAILWLASVIRVVGCLVLGDAFAGEPTLALLAIVLLPYLLRRTIARRIRI